MYFRAVRLYTVTAACIVADSAPALWRPCGLASSKVYKKLTPAIGR